MSLAALAPVQAAPLSELVDGIALRTGAWVVVDQLGAVLTHGAGAGPCPPPVVEALLAKSTAPLREAVVWSRGASRLTGLAGGVEVTPVELGRGGTVWFVGGPPEESSLPLLSSALGEAAGPVTDALVEAQLHPRGPSRPGAAPAALVLVLLSAGPVPLLARAALSAVSGTAARVHAEPDAVVVALAADADASAVVQAVRGRCADAVSGACAVPSGASDWAGTAAVARSAARAALHLGIPLGHATGPAVLAELVIERARQSVQVLTDSLPVTPVQRLREHDARSSGVLVASLSAWCAAGLDVAAAAAQLHVHPNTLRYRLRRAEEVCGLDLSEPRHVLALQLLLAHP